MPFYEYRCEADHVFERRATFSEDVAACACGKQAKRAEVNRVAIVGAPSPKIPVSTLHEASAEVDYHYSKAEKERGEKVARPNLWKQAKAIARQRGT